MQNDISPAFMVLSSRSIDTFGAQWNKFNSWMLLCCLFLLGPPRSTGVTVVLGSFDEPFLRYSTGLQLSPLRLAFDFSLFAFSLYDSSRSSTNPTRQFQILYTQPTIRFHCWFLFLFIYTRPRRRRAFAGDIVGTIWFRSWSDDNC